MTQKPKHWEMVRLDRFSTLTEACNLDRVFNSSRAKTAGRVGGKSTSAAKLKAARKNGKAGGRRPTRTLAERLLGRKIHDHEREALAEAYKELLIAERTVLEDHFQLSTINDPLHTTLWRQKSRSPTKHIRYLIDKFRLALAYHARPQRPLKEYIVEVKPCPPERQAAWDRRKSGIPCPPTRQKVYFEKMPYIKVFEARYRAGAELTAESILEEGGSTWTKKRAEGALTWLRSKYDQR
jgi:hypothetical protein